jgi:PAS domain S-box-containing protein
MVWTADPKGTVRFVNRRWEEYTGKPLDDKPTPDWGSDLIDSQDAERVRARWQLAVMHPTEGFSEEFRLRRASDGQSRWMLSVAIPRRDHSGEVVEWVGTLTDIDDQKRQTHTLEHMVRERTAELQHSNAALTSEIEERKAIEEQLRAVAGELERSNGELEKFAYIASHDLQEPLRKIQAFGDRLRDKCRDQLPDVGREYVDRMLSASARMRRLIDDLLSFSRVTTQKKPFHPVDLDKLVREVVSDLDVRIAQSGGTVEVKPLPQIDADPTQMRQLFQNLIANAVKFQRPGVPPVVEVESELVNHWPRGDDVGEPVAMCCVTVRDNGIGFNEKYRDRIFEMFQRLHRRDAYEGTGVGLAICRKIVERHGGTITAQSQDGHGATFVVILPVRQPHAHEGTEIDVYPEQTDHDPDSG